MRLCGTELHRGVKAAFMSEMANSNTEMEVGNAGRCFVVQQYLLMVLLVSAGIAWGGGSSDHRNAESFRLEKSFEIHSPTPPTTSPRSTSLHPEDGDSPAVLCQNLLL